MAMLELGEPFGLIAFALALCLFVPIMLAAAVRPLNMLMRPLALVGLAASSYTFANGLAHLLHWDVATAYAHVLATTTIGSRGEILAVMLVPVWPYGAVALGAIFASIHALILWRKAAVIRYMTSDSPDAAARRDRERAGIVRWER